MLRYGVYASRWPLADQTVWTIVNRNEYDVSEEQMSVPYKQGMRFYDLYHGVEAWKISPWIATDSWAEN